MYWIPALFCMAASAACSGINYAENESIKLLQLYLQLNTTTCGDLSAAVEFWKKQALPQGATFAELEFVKEFPVILLKWKGTNSSLGSIVLNSHMDVVPANEKDGWSYPPFSGQIDENGVIYGRGAQDTKSTTIAYFEALKRLKAKNVTLSRDVYMVIVPDEEVGSGNGWQKLLKSQIFTDMNVRFVLDEGLVVKLPPPSVGVFYQDKVAWRVQVDCYGAAAHGAKLPPINSTAMGKCYNIMTSLFKFRDEEYKKKEATTILGIGSYTTVNLNIIRGGGPAVNVIPDHITLIFDIRLATTLNEDKFEAQLNDWISGAGDNITMMFLLKNKQSKATSIGISNPYWTAVASTLEQMGLVPLPMILGATSDSYLLRDRGIPAFGFSPIFGTDSLQHAVDERVEASMFLKGIDIYENLVPALANLPAADKTYSDPSENLCSCV